MKVNIKGTNYNVAFKNHIADCADGVILGRTNHDYYSIEIKNNRTFYDTCKTIVHELLHAYFYQCGLFSQCDDEDLVKWIESQYFDILDSFIEIFKSHYPEFKILLNKFEQDFKNICKKNKLVLY